MATKVTKYQQYRQYRHRNCLPITDMPIWKKSADVADVNIISARLYKTPKNPLCMVLLNAGVKSLSKINGVV